MEDKEILKRINQGWEPAFKELFGRYYTTLCAFASRIVKNEESAKDIVQEVFIKLWSNRGQLKDISLKSYLFVCVRNTSLTFLRDQKRKEDQLVQIPWEEEETASYLIEEENNRLLFEAIAKLPAWIKEDFNVFKSAPFFLEITHKDVDKGAGLLHLADYLNIKQSES